MPEVDISVVGDKKLEKKFRRLALKDQKKVTRKAMRDGAKRAKGRIVDNIKADDLIDSGNMLNAFQKTKIRSQTGKSRSIIRIGPLMPTRDELNIDANDKFYYPAALEKRFRFMKNAIDKFRVSEIKQIGRDIGLGIQRLAKR